VIGQGGSHRGGAAERLMDKAEGVVHEVQRDRVHQVLDLLGKCVRQADVPPHAHPHCEILALNMARADVGGVRATDKVTLLRTVAPRRTIAGIAGRDGSVGLDELRVTDVRPERLLDRIGIRGQPVRRELRQIDNPAGQVEHEFLGVGRVTQARAP
jgi:hypothetical protein